MFSKHRYEVKMDDASKTPLHYLSVLLKYTMPKDFVWDQNLKKMVEYKDSKFFGVAYPDLMGKEKITAGSWADGIAVPDYFYKSQHVIADIDKLTIDNNTYYVPLPSEYRKYSSGQYLRIEHNPDTHPNYDLLTPTEEYKKARMIQGEPIQSKYIPNDLLKKTLLEPCSQVTKDTSELSIHGPAVTIIRSPVERDEVGVIYFPGWPIPATDWATRERVSGWPSQQIIDKVLISGFYMAGVGRKGVEMSEYEWRYSFNITEKILAHSFTRVQRQVYVYLKLLRKLYFSDPCGITSYSMKTLFFWVCENLHVDLFQSTELGRIMLHVLDELIKALSTHFLRNFYITSMNMFEDMSREHCTILLEKVSYVRNNLIQCLVDTDGELLFLNLFRKSDQKIACIFKDALCNVKKAPQNEEEFRNSVTIGLKGLLKYYLQYMLEHDDKFPYRKQAPTNVLVEMIGEVLIDLHSLACDDEEEQEDFNQMTISLIFDVSKDPKVISKTLLLLKLYAHERKFEITKEELCSSLQRFKKIRQCDQEISEVWEQVKTHIETFTERDLPILDNEVIYQIDCLLNTSALLMDTATKQESRQICRQM